MAFDAEDDDEKEDNEDQEEQHEDKSDFDESQTSVEPDTEPSHDCDVPHKDDSTTEECWNHALGKNIELKRTDGPVVWS